MSKKRQRKPDDMKQLKAGAEPFWMQDIRLAQRSINAERARLRATHESGTPGSGGTSRQD